jgi:Tfp pilus assembly protein PilO
MLLFAIVILLLGAGGLYILHGQIGDARQKEAAKVAEVGSNKQIASRYQTALSSFKDTQSKLQYLEASVPVKSYVPTLLQQLQSLAKSTNLVMSQVRPGTITQAMANAPTPPGSASSSSSDSSAPAPPKQIPLSYSTMSVNLEVDGTYTEVMKFLYDLPKFPKILDVQSVALHPGQGAGQLSATVQLIGYVFDPAKDVQLSKPLQRLLQSQGVPPTIAGANVQAAAQASGVMTPEARAIGIARNDAAIGDEQATGQGILAPSPQNAGAASATPNIKGGIR